MSILKKKLTDTLKIASDRTDTKQNNLYFTRKDMGPPYKRLGNNWTKKNKKTATISLYF